MDYLLMNKDKALLSFRCERNEFDEVEAVEQEWFSNSSLSTTSPEFGTDMPFANQIKQLIK